MRPALRLAVLALMLGAGAAACDVAGETDAPSLLGLAPAEAPLVVRMNRSGLAVLPALVETGATLGVLADLPSERLEDALVAFDTAGAVTALGLDVTGNASDFSGLLASLGRTHRGAALFRIPGSTVAVGVLRGELVVAPEEAALVAALDRRAGVRPSLADDPVAARLFRRVQEAPLGLVTSDLRRLPLGVDSLEEAFDFVPVDRVAFEGALDASAPSPTLAGVLWLAPRAGTSPGALSSLLTLAVGLLRQQTTDAATAERLADLAFSPDGADVRSPVRLPLSTLRGISVPGVARADRPVRPVRPGRP